MSADPLALVALGAIALAAAAVNGALGYGFSSITVPLALLVTTSRVLNPALVLVEVGVNAHALLVERSAVPTALRRSLPLALGVAPGVVAGSAVLAMVNSGSVKLATYALLLPLILAQVGGLRRALRAECVLAAPVGAGIGALYALTTISGPPLALFLSNQGYDRRDFRASLAVVRLIESSVTAVTYAVLGLYGSASVALVPWIVPSVVVGVPLGATLGRRVDAATFRRLAMGFGALVVAVGLSRTLADLGLLDAPAGALIPALVALALVVLLRRPIARGAAAAISGTGGE